MSMQVDRLKQQRIFWSGNYLNPNSHEYQTLEDESNYAVSAANIGQKWHNYLDEKVLSLFDLSRSAELNAFFSDRFCDGIDLPKQRLPIQLDQPVLSHERQGHGQRHARDDGQPLHQVHRSQAGHTAKAHTGKDDMDLAD